MEGSSTIAAVGKDDSSAAARTPRRWTYAEVRAEVAETNQPCELWEGELIMSPAPSFYHQKIVLRLFKALDAWVSAHELGEVVTAPIDMVLSDHRTTQPDVAFIAKQRLEIIHEAIDGAADLTAEVVSLGGRSRDRIEKRDLYEQYGVREYWIVDPEAQTVEVLHLEKGTYQLIMRCGPGQVAQSKLLPGFQIEVRHLLGGG